MGQFEFKLTGSLPAHPHPSNTNNPGGDIYYYAIPPDNPFIGATNFNGLPVSTANVRTEFYAVGLRNPWRFTFDSATGVLYCGQCHQPGGTALGVWDTRIVMPLLQSGIVNGELNNNSGDTNNRVIAPGSLEHSMLLTRTATRGSSQMPPLDSTVLDTNAIHLLRS
jgi:hypothetical protein